MNHRNNAHLKIGDEVMCLENVSFSNGEKHEAGKVYVVEPDTQVYFFLFTEAGLSRYAQQQAAQQKSSFKYLKIS